jgi:hypothetical protein
LYRPVIAGIWQQHQATDGTYSFIDLLTAHEMLDVKEANEANYKDWLRRQEQNG